MAEAVGAISHAKRICFVRFFGHFACETLAFRKVFWPKLHQNGPEMDLRQQKMDTYVLLCGLTEPCRLAGWLAGLGQ